MSNEKNELLNNNNNNKNSNEFENIQELGHSSLPLQPIHLTPQQQFELAEHLSPVVLGNNNNNNNINAPSLVPLSKSTSSSSIKSGGLAKSPSQSPSDNLSNKAGEKSPTTIERKKKKKKEGKKKKKKKGSISGSSDGSSDDSGDRKVIERGEGYQHQHEENFNDDSEEHYNQYSTEMSNFDKNIKQLASDIIGGNNDMYMIPKKEKKKKKKKQKEKEMDNLTPEERRIREEAKDAKSFFSNERTFLSWIGLTFSLGAIGTAIITWFGTEGVSLATGLFLWIIAILFMAYSTIQFRRRGEAIRSKTQGPFDDQKGPLALVTMVFIGVSIYLVFFVVIRPSANIDIGTRGNHNQTKT